MSPSASPSAAALPRPLEVNFVDHRLRGVSFKESFSENRTGGTVHCDNLLPAYYSLQVKGRNGTPVVWSCTLEGSQDGENWWVIITHNSGTYSDGTPAFSSALGPRPYKKLRLVMAALNLGSATDATAVAVAV